MMGENYGLIAAETKQAYERIKAYVRKTPLDYSPWLSDSCSVYIKREDEQITNSFKLRGAVNKVQKLCQATDTKLKIVTASSGNHGLACARSVTGTDVDCTIVVLENISSSKVKGIKRTNATLKFHGTDCVETELFAKNYAEEIGALYVSPYNDPDVVAGQGTIGIEILEDLPSVDAVFISVGGGGLISGISAFMKNRKPDIKIIGCQPENSKVMYESIKHGSILDIESLDTLSDGTAGGVEQGSITFDICKDLVDEWVLVSEDEISYAVYKMLQEHCKVVEGAAGVAIASFLKTKNQYAGKNVVIVSCGGNISVEKLKYIINKHEGD
ncbi:L-threonine ammonia-lyase-like [Rhopilema esculentum]|uniref:L-threonine ammonia-lyase-like n=1 Tax=Rhopilema esculentum TaxID=499914 RepID=UPI0031D75052